MKIQTVGATGVLLLSLTACSGGASNAPASAAAPPTTTAPASATGSGAEAGTAIPITERDFKFDTPDVAVSGVVSLAVTNAGPTVHDLTIRDTSGTVLGETEDLKPGASETLTVDLSAGKYVIFCSLPGHESLGLKGTLTVTK
jgi:plastocyanin